MFFSGNFKHQAFPIILLVFFLVSIFVSGILRVIDTTVFRPHREFVQPMPDFTRREKRTQPPAPAASKSVAAPPVRSLDQVPPNCKACGGPATQTTVEWRGSRPVCGYCGSGF